MKELENRPQHLCRKCGKCCRSANCKKLGEDNLCLIYEERPEVCRTYPYSLWNGVPEGCGYEGWIFQKREEKKQQIRKQKELLLSLEVLLKTAPSEESAKIKESIAKIQDLIEIYADYGSHDW